MACRDLYDEKALATEVGDEYWDKDVETYLLT